MTETPRTPPLKVDPHFAPSPRCHAPLSLSPVPAAHGLQPLIQQKYRMMQAHQQDLQRQMAYQRHLELRRGEIPTDVDSDSCEHNKDSSASDTEVDTDFEHLSPALPADSPMKAEWQPTREPTPLSLGTSAVPHTEILANAWNSSSFVG